MYLGPSVIIDVTVCFFSYSIIFRMFHTEYSDEKSVDYLVIVEILPEAVHMYL